MSDPVATATADPDRQSPETEWPLLPPGPPVRPTRAPRRTLRDLAVPLFYRARLLLFCVVLGLLGGVAAAILCRTIYTADTVLIVLVGSDSVAVQDSLNPANTQISVDGLKAVQSEVQIIRAYNVASSTIETIGVDKLYPALAYPRDLGLRPPLDKAQQLGRAIELFRSDLRVDAQPNSNVIRISFSNPDRALAVRALQAVVEAYFDHRRSIYANDSTTVLGQEIRRYGAQLAQIETDIEAVRSKYNVLDTAQDIVLATNRLDGVVQRQNQVRERQVAVDTEIVAVKANLASQPPTVLDFRETTNNTGNDEARNVLVRLEQDREHLLAKYNDTWPGLQELDRKIATVRAQIGANSQSLYSSERTIRNPAVDVLNNRLASLEVESKALSQQLVELDGQLRVADDRTRALRDAESSLHTLQFNRDVLEGIYRQMSLREPGAISNHDAFVEKNVNVRVAQPASAPSQGRSLALTFLAGGVFFGLLLGVTAVVVATLLQRVYILPSDAERGLGLPSLGDVAADASQDGGPDARRDYALVASNLLAVLVDERPLSMVQVVSSSEDTVGKADVVRALGIEFARRFALRTLILDLSDTIGLIGISSGSRRMDPPLSIPIAATDEEDLWITINARQALFAERGQIRARAWQAIGELRQRFDMVLIIAPSDLRELVGRRLASVVDANLLVLRAEKTRRVIAARFREMVLEAGGNLAGFVFVGRKYYIPGWLYRRL